MKVFVYGYVNGYDAAEQIAPVVDRCVEELLKLDCRIVWINEANSVEERAAREASDFLKYVDSQGKYADFHGLRHTFVTNLARANVSPKMAQTLARHSDIKLTMSIYPMAIPPVEPMAPKLETFIVDDATLEAIAEVLENNPFGILLVKDELAGWLRSFDCYRSSGGGKDLPAWLSIHGGRMFRINRKTGPKIIRSNNPAVSICGGIQPMVLQRIVDENKDFFESGLTARILFAMPPDKPTYWTEATTSDEALMSYENIFRTLHRWRSAPGAPSPENPLVVRLSPEAKDLFVRFYNSNADERIGLQGDMNRPAFLYGSDRHVSTTRARHGLV